MRIVEQETLRQNMTIEFTPAEQDVLYSVCGMIGGSPTGPRRVMEELRALLGDNARAKKLPSGRQFGYLPDAWTYDQ